MKIALLGYGRQGKKYHTFFLEGQRKIDVYTLHGNNDTVSIRKFNPLQYQLIIIAIAPLYNQEYEIRHILSAGYKGYMIIEKPIVADILLLSELIARKKTLFFIDEAYIKTEYNMNDILQDPTKRIHIDIHINQLSDQQNMLEHAVGTFLPMKPFSEIMNRIDCSVHIEKKSGYSLSMKNTNHSSIFITQTYSPSFDYTFLQALKYLSDESCLSCIRINYGILRDRSSFFI